MLESIVRRHIGDRVGSKATAGIVAHEVRHGLQDITPLYYRLEHELDAYRWQSRALGLGWTDDLIWKELIEANLQLYKGSRNDRS